MSARHFLRCLGAVHLLTPAGEPSRFRTRKHLALLLYLAVEPRLTHRRERLADLLWPDSPEAEGRHSVATAISVLRGKFGPGAFEANRDQIRLIYPHLDVDLDRLAAGNVLGDEFTPPLEVAGFLDDFDIPDAPEFMHWRERQRARLLPSIRDALIRLMDRCRRTGDFRRIEGLADRMLIIDELSEEGIRAKMEARAFDGDRLSALKIFEGWKVILQADLGAAPSPLLEGIALRLRRRGWERTTTNDIPTVPTDQWKGRLFVGRTTEYRALYESWEQTLRRSARHALVLGDSGIGKSTLVERLTTAAGLEGAATARVQCYEVEREIPYAAVSGLVRGLLDRPGVSGTPPDSLAELARTMPEVRQRFSTIPNAPESQGETARVRLAEAMHQLVTAIAEESPVILVIDDVHLADDASVAVVHLLLRRVEQQRIMVLMTARSGELGRSPNASRLRENHQRLGVAMVELPPMSDDEGAQLLDSLLVPGTPQPSATERRAILRAAAGFPMVLELLLRDWQTNGERSIALSFGAMTANPAGSGTPEDAYRQLLDRIIQDLDSSTRNVLNLAAILGGRLNDLGMYALVDLSLAQTMTGMSRLTELRLLRDGGQEMEFRNELIRAQAYLSVPSPLRRALHGQIADRLLEEERQGRELPGLEIAWHCIRSGRMDEGTPYLLRGAREAMQRGAVTEVELALGSALDHLGGSDREQALLLLAEALQEQCRWSESLSLLESRGTIPRRGEYTHARLLWIAASMKAAGSDDYAVAEAKEELLQMSSGTHRPSIRIRAAYIASRLKVDHRYEKAARLFLNALEGIPEDVTTDEAERLALVKAKLLFRSQDPDGSRSFLEKALDLIRSRGSSNSTAVNVYEGLGVLESLAGRYEQGIEYLTAAYDMGVRLGDDSSSASVAANLALSCCRIGQYDNQLRWSELALRLLGTNLEPDIEVQATAFAALAHALKGNRAKALEYLNRNPTGQTRDSTRWLVQAWNLYSADVLQTLQLTREAENTARVATTGSNHELRSLSFAGPYARWIARLGVQEQGTGVRLMELRKALHLLDKKDQAEVLSATVWLDSRAGVIRGEEVQLMERCLRDLPDAVREQLQRLGMLDGLESTLRFP